MLPSEFFARLTFVYAGAPVPRGAATVMCAATDNLVNGWSADYSQRALDLWEAHVMGSLDDTIVLTHLLTKIGPDETGISFELPSGQAGGAGGNAVTPNVSWLVTKNSTLGGRRGRGRMYLPGVNEDSVTDSGIIDNDDVVGLQAQLDLLLANAGDDEEFPFHWCLEHYDTTHWELDNGQPRRVAEPDTAPSPSTITSFAVSNKVATQRRRLRG